ncbi:MAG: hypothetical protein ACD_45C00035G0010 [uncultured bacterium]|nr:MAG: hypothetical protein ACD_45C00035G0010 [uncultured bacterium]
MLSRIKEDYETCFERIPQDTNDIIMSFLTNKDYSLLIRTCKRFYGNPGDLNSRFLWAEKTAKISMAPAEFFMKPMEYVERNLDNAESVAALPFALAAHPLVVATGVVGSIPVGIAYVAGSINDARHKLLHSNSEEKIIHFTHPYIAHHNLLYNELPRNTIFSFLIKYDEERSIWLSQNVLIALLKQFLLEEIKQHEPEMYGTWEYRNEEISSEKFILFCRQYDPESLFNKSYLQSNKRSAIFFRRFIGNNFFKKEERKEEKEIKISMQSLGRAFTVAMQGIYKDVSQFYNEHLSLQNFGVDIFIGTKTKVSSTKSLTTPIVVLVYPHRRYVLHEEYYFKSKPIFLKNQYTPALAACLFNENADVILYFHKKYPDSLKLSLKTIKSMLHFIEEFGPINYFGKPFTIFELKKCEKRISKIMNKNSMEIMMKEEKVADEEKLNLFYKKYLAIFTLKKENTTIPSWFKKVILHKANEAGGKNLETKYNSIIDKKNNPNRFFGDRKKRCILGICTYDFAKKGPPTSPRRF